MSHQHLTELHRLYQLETQPFRKVHRMIDLFESLIKSHTVVIIAEYVKHNKLSDAAKGMLAQGLRTPSLGTWQLFSRILSEELNADGYGWTFPGFAEAITALDKALNTTKTNVIAFRNGYAHGATPSDAQCESDIHQFEPFMLQLLQSQWLADTSPEYRDEKVWMASATGVLCLHPIFLYKEESGSSPYAFFNDLKNDKVGLLNYPLSKHYREKDFYREFHEYLPLQEWKKTGNNEFQQRIEELTETFKGRIGEREKLLDFVRNNSRGYMSIQGNPGIGKSALIAQFFKDLNAHKETHHLQVVEYFIRRGTAQAQVEYLFNHLIRRTDELFAQGREIRAEGKAVWDLQQQLFSKWRLWNTHCEGRKLLFLIDGLDEGVENNVVTYMPRENFENILIIYGSRPGGHKSIDELWSQLPVEHHTKLELSGLGKADIRALIYEVANKYEVERESAWIDAVQQRSQGNPLYLKLLCDAMENGSIALNDIHALPKEIDDYYKAILDRYAHDADGDALLAGLFAFAAARDYLTMNHLGLINGIGDATVQRIGSTLKEVLYENPLTEEVLDYQLFHESFREYLMKEKGSRVTEAAERIIDFCAGWKALEGTWEQRYALEHYAFHLSESKKEVRAETLLQLIYDHSYTAAQKKVLQGFDASNAMYRLALKKSCVLKRDDEILESALCLVDLKYEEANDAPQIVAMVANGEIDLALRRIESYGGVDKEGVQRKFILYMLCLMELTLLDSKDKPHRKKGIEQLLNHLDKQLPVDHSILKWNDFFPRYLMFLMASELAEMGLDYLRVYKRADEWESDLLDKQGPYTDHQFDVLICSAAGISNKWKKSAALSNISSELTKQGKVDEALSCAAGIGDEREKSKALFNISSELTKQGKEDVAARVMDEALSCAAGISDERKKSDALSNISSELAKQGKMDEALSCAAGISDEWGKSEALSHISSELAKQGKTEEAAKVMDEALSCAAGISDERDKSEALSKILSELAKQGKIEEALSCAAGISSEYWKSYALSKISLELAKQGKIEEALSCAAGISEEGGKSVVLSDISSELAKQGKIEEALSCAAGISGEYSKSEALSHISSELAKQGKMDEALSCAAGISDEWEKSEALSHISSELAKQGKIEEALSCTVCLSDERDRSKALMSISSELAKQDKTEESSKVIAEALTCAACISYEWGKSEALSHISSELAKQDKVDEVTKVMQQALSCAVGIADEGGQGNALSSISSELAKQGKVEEALSCAAGISSKYWKSYALSKISLELAKQGKMDEALSCAAGISEEYWKSFALTLISSELAKQGKTEEAAEVMNEALTCAVGIADDRVQGKALSSISSELVKQGKVDEALSCTAGELSEWTKSQVLFNISLETANQGKIDEALSCAVGICEEYWKSVTLSRISSKLVKQGKVDEAVNVMDEALSCAAGISKEYWKSFALTLISSELAKQDKVDEATKVMQQALSCASGISDEWKRSDALLDISTELAKQGNWQLAEDTGLGIPLISKRYVLWEYLAKSMHEKNGWKLSLSCLSDLKNDEARLFYSKGWVKNINLTDVNNTCIHETLPVLVNDSASIEALLQKYAIAEVAFGNPSKEFVHRLNRSLNIQWVMDIASQFPKNTTGISRQSTNIEEWLHEIVDEDDIDQITLWAKQVAKGKITEADFGEKIKAFI